jgi:hypothetical protein
MWLGWLYLLVDGRHEPYSRVPLHAAEDQSCLHSINRGRICSISGFDRNVNLPLAVKRHGSRADGLGKTADNVVGAEFNHPHGVLQ